MHYQLNFAIHCMIHRRHGVATVQCLNEMCSFVATQSVAHYCQDLWTLLAAWPANVSYITESTIAALDNMYQSIADYSLVI
jgi:hypothetical protein